MGRRGFTAVELLIVVAIVAVFGVVVYLFFGGVIEKAERTPDGQRLVEMNRITEYASRSKSSFTFNDAAAEVYKNGYEFIIRDTGHTFVFNTLKMGFDYVTYPQPDGFVIVKTESELYAAAKRGGYVYLMNSVSLDRPLEVEKDLLIVSYRSTVFSNGNAIDLGEGVKLQLCNTVFACSVDFGKGKCDAYRCTFEDVTVNADSRFYGCEFFSDNAITVDNAASVTLENCAVNAKTHVTVTEKCDGAKLTIINCEFKGNGKKIIDNGKNTVIE